MFFCRLLGLDRHAAKAVASAATDLGSLSARQIEFLDMIINHLTERGIIEPGLLYESPFTDLSDQGLSGVFPKERTTEIMAIIRRIDDTAAA